MKVAIGLSGGVDSAVSAALLKKQGHDVLAVFLWCYQTKNFPCTTDQDRAMAVKVADHLHIPLKIIDLRRDYTTSVVDYFFSQYQAGRTPNPDVVCNKEIKFGLFYKQMIEKEKFDYVATGHYARILKQRHSREESARWRTTTPESNKDRFWTSQNDGSIFLAKGTDDTKDQSYFLYTLKETQLEHIMFPVGGYKKEQVRQMAEQFNLPNAKRPDSQGICFIGEVNIKKFLSTKLKNQKGNVLDHTGNIIGQHDGVWFYTIGQRHGFEIRNSKFEIRKGEERKPLYILSKNSERNELVVGEKEECYTKKLVIEDVHWINQDFVHSVILGCQATPESKKIDSGQARMTIRIRHLGEMYHVLSVIPTESEGRVEESSETRSGLDPSTTLGMTYRVILEKPAFAVASGQSAVIYNKDIVLGGGIIK